MKAEIAVASSAMKISIRNTENYKHTYIHAYIHRHTLTRSLTVSRRQSMNTSLTWQLIGDHSLWLPRLQLCNTTAVSGVTRNDPLSTAMSSSLCTRSSAIAERPRHAACLDHATWHHWVTSKLLLVGVCDSAYVPLKSALEISLTHSLTHSSCQVT